MNVYKTVLEDNTKVTYSDNLDVLPDVRAYDNGGKTFDRYTIVINGDFYCMSINANMPNGVNMFMGSIPELQLTKSDKEVSLMDLPGVVREAIAKRMIPYMEKENVADNT